MTSTLQTHGLGKSYDDLEVLRDITLSIQGGELVSIVGPSGAGKTTLLKIIAGLIQPSAGEARVGSLSPAEALRERRCGFASQNPVLLPWRTIMQNIMLSAEITGRGDAKKAQELAEMLGLAGFERYYPNQLSGGMQQRAALARTLLFNPQILLLDEPFGALDETTRTRLGLELMQVRETERSTIVFVTHSIAEAVFLSDRVIVLSERPGRIEDIVAVGLPRPRTLEMRLWPAYADALQCIRKSIYAY
jgi:NitT/TauT family transport system ATP-binding protein